eukprot:447119_1
MSKVLLCVNITLLAILTLSTTRVDASALKAIGHEDNLYGDERQNVEPNLNNNEGKPKSDNDVQKYPNGQEVEQDYDAKQIECGVQGDLLPVENVVGQSNDNHNMLLPNDIQRDGHQAHYPQYNGFQGSYLNNNYKSNVNHGSNQKLLSEQAPLHSSSSQYAQWNPYHHLIAHSVLQQNSKNDAKYMDHYQVHSRPHSEPFHPQHQGPPNNLSQGVHNVPTFNASIGWLYTPATLNDIQYHYQSRKYWDQSRKYCDQRQKLHKNLSYENVRELGKLNIQMDEQNRKIYENLTKREIWQKKQAEYLKIKAEYQKTLKFNMQDADQMKFNQLVQQERLKQMNILKNIENTGGNFTEYDFSESLKKFVAKRIQMLQENHDDFLGKDDTLDK